MFLKLYRKVTFAKMQVKSFTFGPFQENTFVLYDNTGDCVIVDPGCYSASEENELKNFVSENKLNPKMLLNTHCHVDHIAGNSFVFDTYGLKPIIHEADLFILNNQQAVSTTYGLPCNLSPQPLRFMFDGELITFGNTTLKVIHTPGHAPGHVVFYNAENKILINGDVLFKGSIGRTDLPGGDFETLINSIKQKLFVLPDTTVVYSGHGSSTTIGNEKKTNPFLT